MNIVAVLPAGNASAYDAMGFLARVARLAAGASVEWDALIVDASADDGFAHQVVAAGAACVTLATHASLATPMQNGQLLAALVLAVSGMLDAKGDSQTLFLLPAGELGDELAARAAVRCNGVALGRCTDLSIVDGHPVAKRPALGGRVDVQLQALHMPCFATVQADRRQAQSGTQDAGRGADSRERNIRLMTLTGTLPSPERVEYQAITGRTQRLETARVVVCGGRGVGGAEGFGELGALADALDGALGGSLPAVDAGWIPVAAQVGQSGKYVTPVVYIAVGISGTLQHLAGVGADTRIVAINSDPEASIFEVAEVGIVGDWRDVVSAMVERLSAEPQPP